MMKLVYCISGVGRWQLDECQYSHLLHDYTYRQLVAPSEIQIVKNLIRGERAACKINGAVLDIPPSWIYLTTNEILFNHHVGNDPRKRLIQMATYDVPQKLAREHIAALKNRCIEVLFRKQSDKVLPEVFQHSIPMKVARVALSVLILKKFKDLTLVLLVSRTLLQRLL